MPSIHRAYTRRWTAILCVVVALSICGVILMRPQTGTYLRTKYSSYSLEVAGTPLSQHVGLGGRVSMAQDQGMLFVFNAPDTVCFWMKDMRFSLDIIWLDAQKEVVHIEKNVSPETFPKTYCPDKPAQYVIELNAGEAARNHLVAGHRLSF